MQYGRVGLGRLVHLRTLTLGIDFQHVHRCRAFPRTQLCCYVLITVLCPAPTPSGWHIAPTSRVSPVPNETLYTFRHPYADEFIVRCISKIFPHVRGLRQGARGSALICLPKQGNNDAAVFALCCGLRTCLAHFQGPLSLGFNAGFSPGPRICTEGLRRQSATGRLGPYPDRTCTG